MALEIVISGTEDYLGGDAFIKALIMGDPGAGKTRSASFWPAPIFADCENGRMSLADRKLPVAKIRSSADMDQLLLMCFTESRKPMPERKFKTLVIDTFDRYQRILIQERLRKEKKDRLSGWDDWGFLDGKTAQLLERLQNLRMNVVVNLHIKDQVEGTGDDKLVYLRPLLKGDVKDQIAGEFDLVGHMETYWKASGNPDNPRVQGRRILWAPDPKHPALKDRSGQLSKYTEIDFTPGDFSRILDPIVGYMDQLPESEQFATVETSDDSEPKPVGPMEGGPTQEAPEVAGKKAPKKATKAPAKKTTAAKPAADKPADPPAEIGADTAPAPESTTSEKAETSETATAVADPPTEPAQDETTTSGAEQAPTPEEALENLQAGGITGEVISDSQDDDNTDAAAEPETPEPAAAQESVRHCGDPMEGTAVAAWQGCGKALNSEAKPDLVGLSGIKFRTYLCNDDYYAVKEGRGTRKAS
jgi:hypothetical protein